MDCHLGAVGMGWGGVSSLHWLHEIAYSKLVVIGDEKP